MNPLATAWVAKLRSGEIEQLQNKLTNTQGTAMCCMGVLCLVAGLERQASVFLSEGRQLSAFAPQELTDSIGLSPTNVTQLIDHNDCDEWDFHEIADCIEGMLG
jgi:hypothetical protein